MIVVADSSPLHYLILLGHANLLCDLYGQVFVPTAVVDELTRSNTPSAVKDFLADPPHWLLVQSPQTLLSLNDIDEGEKAAISLAQEFKADLLLIDDLDGRRAAIRCGLKIAGLIGVLLEASRRNLIELPPTLQQLTGLGFYLSKDLLNRLLDNQQ